MEKHKLIFLIFILSVFTILACITCVNCNNNPASAEITNLNRQFYPGNLIPFAEYDSQKHIRWGYLDEETREIIINAKYIHAGAFVGNYTVVTEEREYQTINNSYNKTIINKAGERINLDTFKEAYLLISESGKNHAVILKKTGERKVYIPFIFRVFIKILGGDVSLFTNPKEKYSIYSMVNLENGETIIPEEERILIYEIETAGDYLVVRQDLYQFMENGDIQCVVKDNPELAVSILEEYFLSRGIKAEVDKGITRISINYRQYIEEKYANPDFSGAFKKLDPKLKTLYYRYENFRRDPRRYLNTPLEITERKYLMEFRDEKTNEYAKGIYNETKDEWEIPPDLNINFFNQTSVKLSIKNVDYYVIDIEQTNNPNLYRLHFKNNENGRNNRRRDSKEGGIYSTVRKDFLPDLYLFEGFPSDQGGFERKKDQNISIPEYGVYYRDLSRIME